MSKPRHNWMRVYWRTYFQAAVMVIFALGTVAWGQQNGQYHGLQNGQPLQFRSFTHVRALPPREFRTNDLITVNIDYRSTTLSEGDMQRRKQAGITAVLADWIRLRGADLKPATQADGDPTINGTLNSQYRATSDAESTEAMRFSMAARIVEVRPNGLLVIHGKRTIQNNGDTWTQVISGIVRPEDVLPNNSVRSEDIFDLYIHKSEEGDVPAGYRPGMITRFLDFVNPF
ncbi:MAG: flagellar basal body L-ring protein FlgH [Pirellulales bacterium]|nr:flagellar basal body L-ring protein FlgH [Pirellulales bacterium]